MIELTEEEKQYIQDNKNLIEQHKYQEFFDEIPSAGSRSDIAEFIYLDAQVNFLPYLTEIPSQLFWAWGRLTDIIIPSNIIDIGYAAFLNCTNLENITILNGVRSIDDSAFDGCKSLETITIPKSVSELGESIFYECDKLDTVIVPSHLRDMPRAFNNCNAVIEWY